MKQTRIKGSKRQRGFTLIEIAIVLVIIGLLLGGVLQGQQLIENSRVKSATNDFNGIAAAVFSYQDRYGRLPGDDPGAVSGRGSSWTRTVGGNGNGVIAASTSPFAPATDDEVTYFFQDLRSAGFIAGDPGQGSGTGEGATGVAALPANPFGGLITIETANVLASGDTGPDLTGTKVCMGNVSGTAAIALDTQLDDGLADSGRFRGSDDEGTANTAPADTADAAYSEDLTYTVCYRI